MPEAVREIKSAFMLGPMLVINALVLFLALLAAQADLVLLASLIFWLAILAGLMSRAGRNKTRCWIQTDKTRLFVGDHLQLSVQAECATHWPQSLEYELPGDLLGSSEKSPRWRRSLLLFTPHYHREEIRTARQRGIFRIGPVSARIGDPFGFFPKTVPGTPPNEVVVYPGLIPLNQFTLEGRILLGLPGAQRLFEDPVYFRGTREYQDQRPARFIHWKASARHQKLQEKVFEPSENKKILLIIAVDGFAHQPPARFERTIQVVASLACHYLEEGCAVGLLTNGRVRKQRPSYLPPKKNSRQTIRLLETLAGLTSHPEDRLADRLHHGMHLTSEMTQLYIAHDPSVLSATDTRASRSGPQATQVIWQTVDAALAATTWRNARRFRIPELCLPVRSGRQ